MTKNIHEEVERPHCNGDYCTPEECECSCRKCEIRAAVAAYDDLRSQLKAALEGQEILKRQTIRIREALGGGEGDTEELAKALWRKNRLKLGIERRYIDHLNIMQKQNDEVRAQRDRLAEVVRENALVAIANLLPDLQRHQSVVLKEHGWTCEGAGFCIPKDAKRRLKNIEAALAELEKKP